ncbi:MAG TPA: hypothetical protein VK934_13040 [Fimbriimonas sp.]|nr:hypothetical protein [Fimbriimonas sp.]
MTPIPLLVSLMFLPGIEQLQPMDLLVGDGLVAVDTLVGEGPEVAAGRAAKLEFTLTDGLGHVLQSSSERGQHLTYVPGSGDLLLEEALTGAREGTERTVWFSSDKFATGIGSFVPPRSELRLELRFLKP